VSIDHSFSIISSIELKCPDDYIVEGRNILRRGDAIMFNSTNHGAIAKANIFYGPYWTLSPGVYLFGFNGELDGELKVDFACQEGVVVLKTLTIDNFLDPVCLAVIKTSPKFEVRGFKTPALNVLKLNSISVETISFPLSLA